MAVDISKIYSGVITEINLYNATQGSLDSGTLSDGTLVMKAEPYKVQNSQKEELILAYDLSIEATIAEIKNFQAFLPYNNQVTDVKFKNIEGNDMPKLTGIRINVGIEGDFSEPGKAVIKITGKKRIEADQLADYFSFVTS